MRLMLLLTQIGLMNSNWSRISGKWRRSVKTKNLIIVFVLFLYSCSNSSSTPPLTSFPEFTKTPTPTIAETPLPTPAGPFNTVTNPEQESQMSVLTIDDLKSGKLAEWELVQANKLGPIAKDPSKIDLVVTNIPSVGVSYLSPSNPEKTGTTRATKFFSLYKIKLDPWGFLGIVGYVASYIWEDKNGDKAMLHFLLGKPGVTNLNQYGWFGDPLGFYINPSDSMDDLRIKGLFLPSHVPSPDDIRSIVDAMYTTQGLTKTDIKSLFTKVTSSGAWGDNKDQLESILFDVYINFYAPLDALRMPAPTAESGSASLTVSPTLSPDTMTYQFDPSVSKEDQALIKKGVEIARYYLINNYGRDIKGSYVIMVINNPGDQSSGELGRVNGEGIHQVLTINVGHHWWQEYDLAWRLKVVVHEFTHLWQSEQGNGSPGCRKLDDAKGLPASHDPRTRIFQEGQAEYNGHMATGLQDLFNLTTPDAYQMLQSFDQRINSDYFYMAYAVRFLIKKTSPMAFTNYCDGIGQGKIFDAAFESAFGMTYQQFVKQLKDGINEVRLGCQDIWTCTYESLVKYGSLTPMIDYSLTSPSLIIKVTDQENRPVADINLILYRAMYNNLYLQTGGEDNGTDSSGILPAPVLPGTYSMHFCAPKYPSHGGYSFNPTYCVYELNPFEVLPGQTKAIEFRYWDIQDRTLSSPNFLFTLLGVDGQPLGNQYVQVCGYDAISTVCLNGQTDDSGVFRTSLKPGNYLVREIRPGRPLSDSRGYLDPVKHGENIGNMSAEYEIRDIKIEATEIKSITYQFPTPNLQIKFLDANGSPTPYIGFYLCRSADTSVSGLSPQDAAEKQMTGQILSRLFGKSWDSATVKLGSLDGTCFLNDSTDKYGNFQIKVDPGKYFLYFNNPNNPGIFPIDWTFDHMLSDIVVTDNDVTIVSADFK